MAGWTWSWRAPERTKFVEARSVVPAVRVMVRTDGGRQVATGELLWWLRAGDGGWHGHVEWTHELGVERAVVPADQLRPVPVGRIDVWNGGSWVSGQLRGWRRRSGYGWEAQVRSHSEGRGAGTEWVPAGHVRPPTRETEVEQPY